MKKLLHSLLPFFLAVAMCVSPVSAAAQGAAPDAIQPEHVLTAPGVLYQVSNAHQVYVYRREVPDGYYEAVLNTFDGRELLVANEISLLPDWILVENKSGKFGVYDYTMKEVLPCQYESLWMIDADTCIVYTKIYYTNRFGGVHGDSLRCNLRTGEITDVGITDSGAWWQTDSGKEVAAKRMDRVTPLSFQETPAPTGYIVQGTDAGGAYSAAYNDSQQLILKTYDGTLSFDATDRMLTVLPLEQGDPAHVYSGRGRWIADVPEISYIAGIAETGYYWCRQGNPMARENWIYNMDGIPVNLPPEAHKDMDVVDVREFSDNRYDVRVGACDLYCLPEYMPAPSDWASEDAAEAVELGLVDEDIQWWWKDACTREEFCRMVVHGLEAVTGRSGAELAAGQTAEPFSDCDSEAVAVASALGIVNGVGHGQFAPGRFLTRQQAATMLARAAAYLGYEPNGDPAEFADADTFADWAAEGIAAVSALRCGAKEVPLMQGKTGGVFDPNGYYTVEQAAVTVLRMVQFC